MEPQLFYRERSAFIGKGASGRDEPDHCEWFSTVGSIVNHRCGEKPRLFGVIVEMVGEMLIEVAHIGRFVGGSPYQDAR